MLFIILGYWTQETSFLADVDKVGETTYYDSVTGEWAKNPKNRRFGGIEWNFVME